MKSGILLTFPSLFMQAKAVIPSATVMPVLGSVIL